MSEHLSLQGLPELVGVLQYFGVGAGGMILSLGYFTWKNHARTRAMWTKFDALKDVLEDFRFQVVREYSTKVEIAAAIGKLEEGIKRLESRMDSMMNYLQKHGKD